jgi:hypothetical protein
MSEVVDHLAELTGFRDRDVLDVTLVGAFRDLLRPDCVTIYRPVGESGHQRWLTRARLRADESTPSADSVWADLEDLPALDTLPHARSAAWRSRTAVTVESEGQVMSLFPLSTDRDVCGVLEMRTPVALTAESSAAGVQHPACLPQLPGPAGLQRARHADRPAQPQDLRRFVPARGPWATGTRRSPRRRARASRSTPPGWG